MSDRGIVIYCGFLLSISAFSIDITLPLFSHIAADLGVTLSQVAQTVTVYVACMGVGQFFFGPLSDRLGRRAALRIGLSLFLLGAGLAMLAPSFEVLLLARALQGIGGAVAPVVARAVLRDLYSGRDLSRAMALATGIFSVGPLIGPLLGGTLALLGGDWRVVLIPVALIATGVVWYLVEGVLGIFLRPNWSSAVALLSLFINHSAHIDDTYFVVRSAHLCR